MKLAASPCKDCHLTYCRRMIWIEACLVTQIHLLYTSKRRPYRINVVHNTCKEARNVVEFLGFDTYSADARSAKHGSSHIPARVYVNRIGAYLSSTGAAADNHQRSLGTAGDVRTSSTHTGRLYSIQSLRPEFGRLLFVLVAECLNMGNSHLYSTHW